MWKVLSTHEYLFSDISIDTTAKNVGVIWTMNILSYPHGLHMVRKPLVNVGNSIIVIKFSSQEAKLEAL